MPGRGDLLIASFRPGEGTWIEKLDRRSGERRRLLRGGLIAVARFTPTGHLVYADGDTLFAVPLGLERLEPVGEPVPVIQGIYGMHIAFSDTGTVAYLPADRVRRAELVSVDRMGKTSPVPLGGSLEISSFAASPSGHDAAIGVSEGLASSVWIVDLERGSKRLLAAEGGDPIFSRDGALVTYASWRPAEESFSRRRADGTGDEERLFTRPLAWSTPLEWSPDGRTLLFATYSSRGDSDVWTYSAGKTSPLLASPSNEGPASFSPDGRFIAFELAEAGGENVYVQPFPGPGPRTPVSVGEGREPFWGRDGRRLFYEGDQHLMVVPVQTAPVLRVGPPQVYSEALPASRDVAGDGRALRLVPRSTVGRPQLEVVLNWFEELKRLAPHPRR
jgi:WD40 repeat protein